MPDFINSLAIRRAPCNTGYLVTTTLTCARSPAFFLDDGSPPQPNQPTPPIPEPKSPIYSISPLVQKAVLRAYPEVGLSRQTWFHILECWHRGPHTWRGDVFKGGGLGTQAELKGKLGLLENLPQDLSRWARGLDCWTGPAWPLTLLPPIGPQDLCSTCKAKGTDFHGTDTCTESGRPGYDSNRCIVSCPGYAQNRIVTLA